MDQDIKITAEVLDPQMCRFTVDRPVHPGGSVQFLSREKAKGVPFAERIFEIENVTAVSLSGNVVTVTKSSPEEWTLIGKKVGAAIREQFQVLAAAVPLEESKADPALEHEIRTKVAGLLASQINPGVAMHGGRVDLIDVKNTTIYLRMGGGCQGCGMADVTLKQGIQRLIKKYVPQVTEILDTTEHAAGRNPYYAPTAK